MGKRGPKRIPIEIRFHAKVERGEGCWRWLGAKNRSGGYGMIGTKEPYPRNRLAHRICYEIFYGPIPENTWVLHRCDNPGCVNPDHLFLGTVGDNMRDMAMKERFGGGTLTREDAYAILWRASGENRRKLADEYEVSDRTVRNIAQRRTWPSLSEIHD